jgi:hypothetical protein
MKLDRIVEWLRPQEELVAAFGQARLVRTQDGRYRLRGGSPEDRQQATEWISMFLHKANPVIEG